MSDAPHASAFLGFSALSLSFAQTRTNQPSLLSSVAPLVAALLLLPPGSFSTGIRPPPAPSPPPLWIQSLADLQPPSGQCSAVGSRATSNPAGAEQPPRRRAPAQIRQVTTSISPSKVQIWRGIASSSRFRRVDLRARWVDGAQPFPAPHGSGSPSLSCSVGTFSLAAAWVCAGGRTAAACLCPALGHGGGGGWIFLGRRGTLAPLSSRCGTHAPLSSSGLWTAPVWSSLSLSLFFRGNQRTRSDARDRCRPSSFARRERLHMGNFCRWAKGSSWRQSN
jgi:hypothetical protein